jgi:hypothetical protein
VSRYSTASLTARSETVIGTPSTDCSAPSGATVGVVGGVDGAVGVVVGVETSLDGRSEPVDGDTEPSVGDPSRPRQPAVPTREPTPQRTARLEG